MHKLQIIQNHSHCLDFGYFSVLLSQSVFFLHIKFLTVLHLRLVTASTAQHFVLKKTQIFLQFVIIFPILIRAKQY